MGIDVLGLLTDFTLLRKYNESNLHLKNSYDEEYMLISKSALSPSTSKSKKKEHCISQKVSTLVVASVLSIVRSQ